MKQHSQREELQDNWVEKEKHPGLVVLSGFFLLNSNKIETAPDIIVSKVEWATYDVHMEPVGTMGDGVGAGGAQSAKVGGEDGRGDDGRGRHLGFNEWFSSYLQSRGDGSAVSFTTHQSTQSRHGKSSPCRWPWGGL
jgi:hypothetical protein